MTNDLTPAAARIVDAAARLFYRHGIHAVGVDAIAAESGVTKRTLYDRFGSKDALVAAYLQRRDAAWWAKWQERIAQAPRPRALTVFDAYLDDAETSGRGCAFLNAAAELPPEHPAFAVVRAHKRRVRARLEELMAEQAGDASEQAELLYLLAEGAVAQQGIDGDSGRLRRARALAADLLALRESTR